MRILVLLISLLMAAPAIAQRMEGIFCFPSIDKVEQALNMTRSADNFFFTPMVDVRKVSGCQWGRPQTGVWSGSITARDFVKIYRSSSGNYHLIDRFFFAGVATPWYASASFYDGRNWRFSRKVSRTECWQSQVTYFGGCLLPRDAETARQYTGPRQDRYAKHPVRIIFR